MIPAQMLMVLDADNEFPNGWCYENEIETANFHQKQWWLQKSRIFNGVRIGPLIPDFRPKTLCCLYYNKNTGKYERNYKEDTHNCERSTK